MCGVKAGDGATLRCCCCCWVAGGWSLKAGAGGLDSLLRGSYATLAWASWLDGGWQVTWLSRTGVGSEAGKKYSLCSLEYFGVVGASTDVWWRQKTAGHVTALTHTGCPHRQHPPRLARRLVSWRVTWLCSACPINDHSSTQLLHKQPAAAAVMATPRKTAPGSECNNYNQTDQEEKRRGRRSLLISIDSRVINDHYCSLVLMDVFINHFTPESVRTATSRTQYSYY